MKTLSAAIILSAVIALPAAAATSQPAPKSATPEAPAIVKTDTPCPTIPKDTLLSKTTQRLFETISDACLLRTSGAITNDQFE